MKHTFPRETLLKHCADIKEFLDKNYSMYYESIEIVGSLRRGIENCGDIDLILTPKYTEDTDLMGETVRYCLAENIDWSKYADIEKEGHRYVQLTKILGPNRLNIDIYINNIPENYGLLKVIRTGPESFNKKYCTIKSFGGMLPQGMSIDQGYLMKDGEIIPIYTEEEYFKAIGVEYIKPKDRK